MSYVTVKNESPEELCREFSHRLLTEVNSKQSAMNIILDDIWRETRDNTKVGRAKYNKLRAIEKWRVKQMQLSCLPMNDTLTALAPLDDTRWKSINFYQWKE